MGTTVQAVKIANKTGLDFSSSRWTNTTSQRQISPIRNAGPWWNLHVFREAKITLPVFGSAGLIVGGRTNLVS